VASKTVDLFVGTYESVDDAGLDFATKAE